MRYLKIKIKEKYFPKEDVYDFNLYISLKSELLRSKEFGGYVLDSGGRDIYFMDSTKCYSLKKKIINYNQEDGFINSIIQIPIVSKKDKNELYLCCGEFNKFNKNNRYELNSPTETVIIADLENTSKLDLIEFDNEITIEVFVETKVKVSESIIPLVSKWKQSSSFNSFEAFDACRIDGLDSSGYFGAIFDGRYVYFSPEQHSLDGIAEKENLMLMPQHGIVLRYDTHTNFNDPKSYSAYDAGKTSYLETKGYYGAAFDGRYVYFIPRQYGREYHSRLLRYDTQSEFNSSCSWDAFDIGESHSSQGAAFDGRYIYLCPGFSGDPLKENRLSSRVIRYDTEANFKDKKSYNVVDISQFFGPKTGCFDGAGFDGRYIYFVPLQTKTVVRYDTLKSFNDNSSSWQIFNSGKVGMGMCVGVVFDGRFMYFVPYLNSNVIRFDTRKDFVNPLNWSVYNAHLTNKLETDGFDGGFFDGRYVYFVPFVKKAKNSGIIAMHTNFLRYDTLRDFNKSSSWDAFDASKTSGFSTCGYNAGAFDGRYFYAAPWRDNKKPLGGAHSRILRYDTVGKNGSFSLNYCDYGHNGGLCAAVRGTSFIINTEHGVRSVAYNKTLNQGIHHIVGTYDNKHLKLYIDGSIVAKRKCNGRIQKSNVPITVAKFSGLRHLAQGKIHNVIISKIARSSEYINITYQNITKPYEFIEYMQE